MRTDGPQVQISLFRLLLDNLLGLWRMLQWIAVGVTCCAVPLLLLYGLVKLVKWAWLN